MGDIPTATRLCEMLNDLQVTNSPYYDALHDALHFEAYGIELRTGDDVVVGTEVQHWEKGLPFGVTRTREGYDFHVYTDEKERRIPGRTAPVLTFKAPVEQWYANAQGNRVIGQPSEDAPHKLTTMIVTNVRS